MLYYFILLIVRPPIINPVKFGIGKPSKGAKRTLMLVGKFLQNLANGTVPQEGYNNSFEDFFEMNSFRIKKFLHDISQYPPVFVGKNTYLVNIERGLCSNLEKFTDMIDSDFRELKKKKFSLVRFLILLQ